MELDGEELELAWNGDKVHCDCRAYADEDYVLFVRFSGEYGGIEGASATLTRFDEEDDERLTVKGILRDDGLDLKVLVVLSEDKETVSFTLEGEDETLALDKAANRYANDRYEAKVTWPEGGRTGYALLSRRR